MLNFLLLEWNNVKSIFFKGTNKLLNINKMDSKEEINIKQSHNSKYWRYLNTINFANVYNLNTINVANVYKDSV
jgi:hypothetical protein